MCLVDFFQAMGGEWWAVKMACTCLGGVLLGDSNGEKWDTIKRRIPL